MRGTRGVLHNLSILTAGQIASQLINVWALVYLADRLGAHWFGVVQIGVAFMAYALNAAEWGLFSLGIREVSRLDEPAAILDYARRHTGLLALQAVAVFLLGLLVLPRLGFYANDPVIFLLYLAAVLPQVFMLSWLATGIERMAWVGAVRILRSLVYALLVVLLVVPLDGRWGLSSARWVPVMWLVSLVAGNVVIGLALHRWFGSLVLPRLPRPAELRRRWHESLPIGAGIVVLRVLLNIDLIILGLRATPEAAGHYAAASRLIFLLIVAVEVLWSALLPRLSRLAHRDPAGFRRAFNLYLGFVLAGLLPVAVGGRIVGGDLIGLIYGDQYAAAAPVFGNLAISYTLLAVAMFLGNSLVASDRQRAYFPPLVLGAATAVTGAWLLAGSRGPVGVSWAMLAAHGLLAVCLIVTTRRLFRRSLGAFLLMLTPVLAAMGWLVAATAGLPVLARIAMGALLYSLLAAWPLRRFHRRNPEVLP